MNRPRPWPRIRRRRTLLALAMAMAVAGCAAGPEFVVPPPPPVGGYTANEIPARLAAGAGEPAQQLAPGQALVAQWWELYRSPRLNQILRQAIVDSPTLVAAEATLAQARQAVSAARGALAPQLDASATARRQQTAAPGSTPFNSFALGPTLSYAPDLFGATRRQVEQQEALAENQRYQLAAAYLALTGSAVSQAINIAATRLQIRVVEELVAGDQRNLHLVRLKFEGGKAARLDLLTAESRLANDRTQLPSLRQQQSVAEHALALLTGQFPGQHPVADFDLSEFTLPAVLPVSVPSALVHQRPDILAAEAQLHARSAAIGVAAAQLYPSITLSGSLGVEALSTATLFDGASVFWNLAADLAAPLFHGHAIAARQQAAIDAFRAAAATYQQTVLTAFGEVADVLRALANDAELVRVERRALDSSATALQLQRLSYTAGKSELLQLLEAQRADQQARLGYARARAQRYQDTARLFVAMGGGWWEAPAIVTAPAAR